MAVGGSTNMPLNLRFKVQSFPTFIPPSLHDNPSHASLIISAFSLAHMFANFDSTSMSSW